MQQQPRSQAPPVHAVKEKYHRAHKEEPWNEANAPVSATERAVNSVVPE